MPSSAILANYMSILADGVRKEVWKRAETVSMLGKKKKKGAEKWAAGILLTPRRTAT